MTVAEVAVVVAVEGAVVVIKVEFSGEMGSFHACSARDLLLKMGSGTFSVGWAEINMDIQDQSVQYLGSSGATGRRAG